MTINPIETRYAGCRFRSRLEARWAVFFDSIGLRWEYEPQGYEVGEEGRRYLPDFYLTDIGWWVEVKGDSSRLDVSLLLDAVHPKLGLGRTDPFYRRNVLILGAIPRPEVPQAHWTISRSAVIGNLCGGRCAFTGPQFGLHYFAPMPPLADLPAEVTGDMSPRVEQQVRHMGALLVPAAKAMTTPPTVDMTEPLPIPRRGFIHEIERAYEAARTARFEWGEAA